MRARLELLEVVIGELQMVVRDRQDKNRRRGRHEDDRNGVQPLLEPCVRVRGKRQQEAEEQDRHGAQQRQFAEDGAVVLDELTVGRRIRPVFVLVLRVRLLWISCRFGTPYRQTLVRRPLKPMTAPISTATSRPIKNTRATKIPSPPNRRISSRMISNAATMISLLPKAVTTCH